VNLLKFMRVPSGTLEKRVARCSNDWKGTVRKALERLKAAAKLDRTNKEETMKKSKLLVGAACGVAALVAYAGGSPDFVKFPQGYDASFANYTTMNRAGSAAVAKMYANKVAIASYQQGMPAASGSVIVMEVYKPKMDADGKPVVGSDGVNVADKLAAIAVMERRDAWPADYATGDRVGTWGFAIFNPDGSPKQNDLACVTCHTPLEKQDYLFSHQKLVDFAMR
jgi:hypothetical protein